MPAFPCQMVFPQPQPLIFLDCGFVHVVMLSDQMTNATPTGVESAVRTNTLHCDGSYKPASTGRCAVLVTAFLLAAPSFLAGQTNTGRILGTVTDPRGAAVAGAAVKVTDVERGTDRNLVTTDAGEYVAPNLAPGVYRVRIEAKGFKSEERSDIQVSVAADAQIDFTLQTGAISETVVVTAEAPLIETTSSALGGTLSNEEINDLPLNGRNYENLL